MFPEVRITGAWNVWVRHYLRENRRGVTAHEEARLRL